MRTHLPLIPLAGGLLLLAAPSLFSQSPVYGPVDLPTVTVTASRDLPPPEKWQYAQAAGFEVLSNATIKESTALLEGFQRFREALEIVRPERLKPTASLALILCGSGGKFSDYSPDGRSDYSGVVSHLLRDREQMAIVVDLELRTLDHDDISLRRPDKGAYLLVRGEMQRQGDRYDGMEIEHDRQLYRQYTRHLLTQTDFPPPPWLLEGIVQIVMDIEFRDRTINYGKLDVTKGAPTQVGGSAGAITDEMLNPSGDWLASKSTDKIESDGAGLNALPAETFVGDRPFNTVLAGQALLPLEEFFAVKADAPEARNPLGDCLWAKQAYAFVHMCTFRADGKYQKPYATFVQRLANEPHTEALFQECFGLSYKEMLKELYRYVRSPQHQFRHIELTEEGRLKSTEVVFREATQGEIGRIKGDTQRMTGRRAAALESLRVAYARGERDPRLLASLGLEELHAGSTERARVFLEVAAKGGTARPSTYVALARLRLDEAKARPSAPDGKLSVEQMAAVFTPLLMARARQPALPETYHTMAEAWALGTLAPTASNARLVGEGAMLFPFDSELTFKAAQLHAQAGDIPNATALARMGVRFAGTDAAIRERFEKVLSLLPPPPASALTSPPVPAKL